MPKKYKILLSAYACEPNRGSEPGVGWNWAVEIAKRGHTVYVLTRSNNKSLIDNYFKEHPKSDNLFFLYYDLPNWLLYLKKKGLSVNLYYLLWQIGIVQFAKKKHDETKFDLVHHITFGVFRHPSFLYKLKTPLIFGPVGGGEHTPKSLKNIFLFKYQIIEFFRNLINTFSMYSPSFNKMAKNSTLILTKTNQTKEFIPLKFKHKTINYLEIGINQVVGQRVKKSENKFKVLYVGRLIYWKGFDISIPAFAKFVKEYNGDAEFVIIGKGDYKKKIEQLANEYKVLDKITIFDWMEQSKLKEHYLNADVLLFPSLHDSSGNVVLEALSFGLPVISLDCGGPAAVLGLKLNQLMVITKDCSKDSIIDSVAEKLTIVSDINFQKILSENAIARAHELSWGNVVKEAYKLIDEKLNKGDN